MLDDDLGDSDEVVLVPLIDFKLGWKVPIRHLYTSIGTPITILNTVFYFLLSLYLATVPVCSALL